MDRYGVLWSLWLAYFAIVEGVAIVRTPMHGGTFSCKVWAFFAVKDLPKDDRRWIHGRRVMLVSVLAWLFAHFVSGGRVP